MTNVTVSFVTGTDPLGRDIPLDHVVQFHVLGLVVRVESNSSYVTDLAVEAFGAPELTGLASIPAAVRMRIVLEPGEARDSGVEPVHYRQVDRDHLLLRSHGMVGMAYLPAGEGVVYAEEPFARDLAHFRFSVLEGMVLLLLGRHDRHPVHAAALRSGDCALLLQGPTGVGKSTLTYVAHRAGIEVLAEDSVHVQRESEFRVWGFTRRVHLLEDAREHFAELRQHGAVRTSVNGEQKLAIDITPRLVSLPPFVRRARVCLLSRHDGAVSWTTASPAEIRSALLTAPEAELDLNPQRRALVAEALAAPGGWRLVLSNQPDEALPYLRTMLEQLSSEPDVAVV
jgi:hypothetical protein